MDKLLWDIKQEIKFEKITMVVRPKKEKLRVDIGKDYDFIDVSLVNKQFIIDFDDKKQTFRTELDVILFIKTIK